MKNLYELYVSSPGQKPNQETDLVLYDRNGVIVEWQVFSERFQTWFNINLQEVKLSYPATFEKIEAQVMADLEYRKFADATDAIIDMDRDDKLKGVS